MADKHPNAPRGHTVGTGWPSWCYGPNGQAEIFQTQADVPEGWADHPSKAFTPEPKVFDEPPEVVQAVDEVVPVDTPVYAQPAEPDARPNRRPLTLKRTSAS